jgi:tetratricopeptide (TPR) repeat protein
MNAPAIAASHYQAKRYHDALLAFEHQDVTTSVDPARRTRTSTLQNRWITAEDDGVAPSQPATTQARAEFSALPALARRADTSMCRFRCFMLNPSKLQAANESSGTNPTSLVEVWEEAIKANVIYRKALNGAASSLIGSIFQEIEHLRLRQSISANVTEDQSQIMKRVSNKKDIKSTAVAILMASVAASHLHLHETNEVQPTYHGDNLAWNVLVPSALLAADLLLARDQFIQCIQNNRPNMQYEKFVVGRQGQCTIESSLCTLNAALTDERSAVALHSFRVALKVAALSCGKLVLPTVAVDEENTKQPERKRQKKQLQQENPNESTNDAWNKSYNHGHVELNSQERLVDALSFHLAMIHFRKYNKKSNPTISKLFLRKREWCFDEALQSESKVKATGDFSRSSTTAGFLWKVINCLRGLELDVSQNLISSVASGGVKSTLHAVKRLAMSSISRFACDLMGCIHVKKGEYSRAIEMFQLSLERAGTADHDDGTTTSLRDFDADVENNNALVQYRVISNMASCFVAVGDVNTPLELLLHLWNILNESPDKSAWLPQPKALLVGCGSKEREGVTPDGDIIPASVQSKLLWMLYHVSSLAEDWASCLAAAEELMEQESRRDDTARAHAYCACAFALLQCRREKQSQDVARELVEILSVCGVNNPLNSLFSVLVNLYIADGSLTSEHAIKSSAAQCIDLSMSSLNAFVTVSQKQADHQLLFELRILVLNNCGIACLLKRDSVGALRCFREASELIATLQHKVGSNSFWLSIPVHFNLALLFLRDGHIEETARSWFSVRGLLETWESAKKGDTCSLRELRDIHLIAMNRQGLVMAKKNITEGALSWDQDHVAEWVPPVLKRQEWEEDSTSINGVDAAQVSTLDFVMLKYALSVAEQKSSTAFRRNVGSVGY